VTHDFRQIYKLWTLTVPVQAWGNPDVALGFYIDQASVKSYQKLFDATVITKPQGSSDHDHLMIWCHCLNHYLLSHWHQWWEIALKVTMSYELYRVNFAMHPLWHWFFFFFLIQYIKVKSLVLYLFYFCQR